MQLGGDDPGHADELRAYLEDGTELEAGYLFERAIRFGYRFFVTANNDIGI